MSVSLQSEGIPVNPEASNPHDTNQTLVEKHRTSIASAYARLGDQTGSTLHFKMEEVLRYVDHLPRTVMFALFVSYRLHMNSGAEFCILSMIQIHHFIIGNNSFLTWSDHLTRRTPCQRLLVTFISDQSPQAPSAFTIQRKS